MAAQFTARTATARRLIVPLTTRRNQPFEPCAPPGTNQSFFKLTDQRSALPQSPFVSACIVPKWGSEDRDYGFLGVSLPGTCMHGA
jgi:hypothetical protein